MRQIRESDTDARDARVAWVAAIVAGRSQPWADRFGLQPENREDALVHPP
jgi:hypothetical protein